MTIWYFLGMAITPARWLCISDNCGWASTCMLDLRSSASPYTLIDSPMLTSRFAWAVCPQSSHELPTLSISANPPDYIHNLAHLPDKACTNRGAFVSLLRNVTKWAHFSLAQRMWGRSDGRESRSRSFVSKLACMWLVFCHHSSSISSPGAFRLAHSDPVSKYKDNNQDSSCQMISSTECGQYISAYSRDEKPIRMMRPILSWLRLLRDWNRADTPPNVSTQIGITTTLPGSWAPRGVLSILFLKLPLSTL